MWLSWHSDGLACKKPWLQSHKLLVVALACHPSSGGRGCGVGEEGRADLQRHPLLLNQGPTWEARIPVITAAAPPPGEHLIRADDAGDTGASVSPQKGMADAAIRFHFWLVSRVDLCCPWAAYLF